MHESESNPPTEPEPTEPTEPEPEPEPEAAGVDYDASQDEIAAQKAQAHEADKERLAAESE